MPDITAVRPVRRVYLGLAADPYDALSTVVWTEVEITLVKSSTLKWGAQHELARVEPSRATVVLDNTNADFEPLNPASPYYPDLRPLNRLRIVDTWAGVDYIRFTGYVTDWPRSWTGINQATVQIEAYDALGAVLNAIDIPTTPWEMQVRRLIEQVPATGKATWLRFNETSGTVAADSSGFGFDGQYQGSPTLGVPGLVPGDDNDKAFAPIAGSRASLPYKNLISGYPWTLAFRFKAVANRGAARFIFAAYDGPVVGTGYQGVAVWIESNASIHQGQIVVLVANPYPTGSQVITSATVDDGATHLGVIVYASSTDFKIYIDGSDVSSLPAFNAHAFPNDLNTGYAVGNTPAVAFGDFRFALSAVDDALDELLVLDGIALSPAQVSDLYGAGVLVPTIVGTTGWRMSEILDAVGWPSADRDIDPGLTVVQQNYVAGKLNAYMQRLDVTEGGRLFVDGAGVLTFQDRHRVLQAPYTVSQATFGEGAGEIGSHPPFNHGEDDADIYNDIPVGNVGGTVQVARDPTSKARYGWKTLSGLTDLLGTSDEEARDRANRDLALYSQPVTRVRQIVVKPQHEDPAVVWPALLSLGQNSRVTVKAQPPGAPLFTQESHVERLEESVTAKDWQITLGFSTAAASEFWVLGTSALGTGTRLAY